MRSLFLRLASQLSGEAAGTFGVIPQSDVSGLLKLCAGFTERAGFEMYLSHFLSLTRKLKQLNVETPKLLHGASP